MPTYTIVLTPDLEDGGYVVTVPALPEVATQGETREEAIAMARDAIEGYLALLAEDGEEIPDDPAESELVRVDIEMPVVSRQAV